MGVSDKRKNTPTAIETLLIATIRETMTNLVFNEWK